MENASKALIMAGSILMALIVIGALVFMYGKLSNAEQTKIDSEEVGKITDYGQRFEQYNRTIYGSELFSLANLVDDYNKTQADNKGYTRINISVSVKPIADSNYFNRASNINDILNDKNNIENAIKRYEEKTEYKGRTVKNFSQISNREIAGIYGIDFSSSMIDYDIGEELKNNTQTSKLMKNIEEYKNIVTTYTEFKNKKFKCSNVKYTPNGRISSMSFVE